jgi:AraC family transcriptional regulator
MKMPPDPDSTQGDGRFLGTLAHEGRCAGFDYAFRRATVPADKVVEHSHCRGHFVLALDRGYLTAAKHDDAQPPGVLIYTPPGTMHRDRFEQTGARFLAIELPHMEFENTPSSPIRIEESLALADAWRIIGMAQSNCASVLNLEESLLRLAGALSPELERDRRPDWFARAMDACNDCAIDADLSIANLAQYVGVHRVHLARVFRKHLGIGPAQVIQSRRLALAAEQLDRDISLAEIALNAGFCDQSHMTRAIRAATGTTPARLRRAFG